MEHMGAVVEAGMQIVATKVSHMETDNSLLACRYKIETAGMTIIEPKSVMVRTCQEINTTKMIVWYVLDQIQQVENTAAAMIMCKAKKSDHIHPIL